MVAVGSEYTTSRNGYCLAKRNRLARPVKLRGADHSFKTDKIYRTTAGSCHHSLDAGEINKPYRTPLTHFFDKP